MRTKKGEITDTAEHNNKELYLRSCHMKLELQSIMSDFLSTFLAAAHVNRLWSVLSFQYT